MIADIKAYLKGLKRAVSKEQMQAQVAEDVKRYNYPIQPPTIPAGVVPAGRTAPVLAADSASTYSLAQEAYPGWGFPGFPYLSMLATRAEFRNFALALSTELTREWIEFTSSESDGEDSSDKIKAIEEEFERLGVRNALRRGAEHDCYFGGAQFFLDIQGADRSKPLILDSRTIAKGSFKGVMPVEAIWTTPSVYNAIDPAAPGFYKPSSWFMLGQEVHSSRLLTVITRELPDILKPAFNFRGMSLSQLAEPYVDNWLRTRQSVSDLINNFSITALKTSMGSILQGDDDGTGLMNRATLFTVTRSNKGLMLLDKENEDMMQLNSPISGLSELQAQSQEHMCSVSRLPAIILTGISPSGLNASSDGEIRIFYDWISATQESFWKKPLEIILKVTQLSLFGEIDPDIGFAFKPLYQMTPSEESDIRLKNSQSAEIYINAGVIDPAEERQRLADDPESGYDGLDMDVEIVPPNEPEMGDPGNFKDGSEQQPDKEDGAQDANLIESSPDDTLPEVLRNAIAAEIDAINLYEKMADQSDDEEVRKILLDVAKEEKVHIGEFQALLLKLDPEQAQELRKGAMETDAGVTGPAQDADWEENKHPRRDDGKFGSGGGASGTSSQTSKQEMVSVSQKDFPDYIKALKLPPAWTDVRISKNPDADLLAIGKDSKGRSQYVYSEKFKNKQAEAKFERIRMLAQEHDHVMNQIKTAQESSNQKTKDAADCMALISKMGIRPGSKTDTGAKVQAYGATTLTADHVVVDGDKVSLKFTGKKGVNLDLEVSDPELKNMLLKKKKAGGELFPNINEKDLLNFSHSLDHGKFKTKDFRTYVGTSTAQKLVESVPKPKDKKEYIKTVKAIAKKVSQVLGNTPTVALQSYIDPSVFLRINPDATA